MDDSPDASILSESTMVQNAHQKIKERQQIADIYEKYR